MHSYLQRALFTTYPSRKCFECILQTCWSPPEKHPLWRSTEDVGRRGFPCPQSRPDGGLGVLPVSRDNHFRQLKLVGDLRGKLGYVNYDKTTNWLYISSALFTTTLHKYCETDVIIHNVRAGLLKFLLHFMYTRKVWLHEDIVIPVSQSNPGPVVVNLWLVNCWK